MGHIGHIGHVGHIGHIGHVGHIGHIGHIGVNRIKSELTYPDYVNRDNIEQYRHDKVSVAAALTGSDHRPEDAASPASTRSSKRRTSTRTRGTGATTGSGVAQGKKSQVQGGPPERTRNTAGVQDSDGAPAKKSKGAPTEAPKRKKTRR